MKKKTRLTEMQIIRLHDAIWSDPDFKKRYDEIHRKCDEEFNELFDEFREMYIEKMFDKK